MRASIRSFRFRPAALLFRFYPVPIALAMAVALAAPRLDAHPEPLPCTFQPDPGSRKKREVHRYHHDYPHGSDGGLTFALQALLGRHESYMASSESERQHLTSQIVILERDKQALQAANEEIVAENRCLLDQVSNLNCAVADADAQIKNLEAILASAQFEVRRLTTLATRTQELERQLVQMEAAQLNTSEKLVDCEEAKQSALDRWRRAEGRVRELSDDVRRMEEEMRSEKERHGELVSRIERERGIEKELVGAAGRLKGAAAAGALGGNAAGNKEGGGVVSHFVRDILLDNANLQAGILELRELLQVSNEEVQNLREQILLHQPVSTPGNNLAAEFPGAPMVSLEDQLGCSQNMTSSPPPVPTPAQLSKEVHVHHHYHAKFSTSTTPTPRRDRIGLVRRNSRKRASANSSRTEGLSPSPDSSLPSTPLSRPEQQRPQRPLASSPMLPTISTNIRRKQNIDKRWSMQSGATNLSNMTMSSSMPSSPREEFDSSYQLTSESSVFDSLGQIEDRDDESRPTSPESVASSSAGVRWGSLSPVVNMSNSRLTRSKGERGRVLTIRPSTEVDDEAERGEDDNLTPRMVENVVELGLGIKVEVRAETEDLSKSSPEMEDSSNDLASHPQPAPLDGKETAAATPSARAEPPAFEGGSVLTEIWPSLRRSSSHESLVSISGMDIHIAKRVGPSSLYLLSRDFSSRTTSLATSSPPLASIAEVTASSAAIRSFSSGSGGAKSTSQSLAKLSEIVGAGSSNNQAPRATSSRQSQQNHPSTSSGLGKLVGGWVRGRWRIAPQVSPPTPPSSMSSSSPSSSPVPTITTSTSAAFIFSGRIPGINQKGSIPGLRAPTPAPTKVHASRLDENLLRESLAEE